MPAAPENPRRFNEPLKFLPIVFVSSTIGGLYLIYLFWHLLPKLQLGERPEHVDVSARHDGWVQFYIFHVITLLVVLCYVRAILTVPGTIPDGDADWELAGSKAPSLRLQEVRTDGKRRKCKWCNKFKPDRCHHCRICRRCILKMDHHCPWIYNCVGFNNYKYFFLLLFYTACDLHLIVWTMAGSVQEAFFEQRPFMDTFIVLFGETIAAFLGILITLFFVFHILLMLNAMTTIEFCERKMPRVEGADGTESGVSLYDAGFYGNFTAVIGSNPILWLLPFGAPVGNGVDFAAEAASEALKRDLESGRGLHKAKQQQQPHTGTPPRGSTGTPPRGSYGTWDGRPQPLARSY